MVRDLEGKVAVVEKTEDACVLSSGMDPID
jgi:hypothetical protein